MPTDPADLSGGDVARTTPGSDNSAAQHDDTGLDLARSIARGLAGTGRTTRRRARPRRGRPVDPAASGAHPDDRDPQTLDSTIGRLIADQGWVTDVSGARRVQPVGPPRRPGGRPALPTGDVQRRATLVVRTDSTAWATQMKLLAPTALRRLNEELGEGTVTLVEVLGPHLPSWKKGLRSMRDGRGPRDTYG